MNLLKAIRDADTLRPNTMSTVRKAEMLMELEAEFAEMMGRDAPRLCINTGDNTASVEDMGLLMPDGHSECYALFLAAMIDLNLQDSALYAADYSVANRAIGDAKAWWRRNNRPRYSGNWKV